jgi:hypothetical protein
MHGKCGREPSSGSERSQLHLRGFFTLPVPTVYAFSSDPIDPFIAEEYIAGDTLSSLWNHYTEDEKQQQIADIVVTMGETRFDYIVMGDAGCLLGPTVEGSKLFKGRVSVSISY